MVVLYPVQAAGSISSDQIDLPKWTKFLMKNIKKIGTGKPDEWIQAGGKKIIKRGAFAQLFAAHIVVPPAHMGGTADEGDVISCKGFGCRSEDFENETDPSDNQMDWDGFSRTTAGIVTSFMLATCLASRRHYAYTLTTMCPCRF